MDNVELMAILDQLERDKGIDKEILIEAVESAIASAARKVWTVDEEEEVKVVFDRKTGKIAAYADGHEIRSGEFGRIAAQTAKQVVIQKIREAEKDVVYNEFKSREGQIVSGVSTVLSAAVLLLISERPRALFRAANNQPKRNLSREIV